jgi:hypothetical protein
LSQEYLIYAGEHLYLAAGQAWLLKAANIHSGQETFLIFPFLSQEHVIYAGEHLYPSAGQAGEDSLASKGCQHSFSTGRTF